MANAESPDSDSTSTPSKGVFATRDQLRAMAHPLRMQIVERVGRRGTARAADIAADLGIAANSVSYHLRTLARGGVIVEAPEASRDKRDRVWKLAQSEFSHAPTDGSASPSSEVDHDYIEASGATTLAALEWIRSSWVTEIARRSSETPTPEEERTFAGLFSSPMRLSTAQAKELFSKVHDILQKFNEINRDEHGADLPGDPDSDGEALDARVLFTVVGERSHVEQGESGSDGDHKISP